MHQPKKNEQGATSQAVGNDEMKVLELGLLLLTCMCVCLYLMISVCVQGLCVCALHMFSQMPARGLLRNEVSGLWSPAVAHGRACMAQRQLRAASLSLCPWHSLSCS